MVTFTLPREVSEGKRFNTSPEQALVPLSSQRFRSQCGPPCHHHPLSPWGPGQTKVRPSHCPPEQRHPLQFSVSSSCTDRGSLQKLLLTASPSYCKSRELKVPSSIPSNIILYHFPFKSHYGSSLPRPAESSIGKIRSFSTSWHC